MLVKKLIAEERDERYKYLLKHGMIHFVEQETYTLFVELPQIPNIMIVYRKPSMRKKDPHSIQLVGK